MSVDLTRDPRVRGRAIAEIRDALRANDTCEYLRRRSERLYIEAYGEREGAILRSDRFITRGPDLFLRNVAKVLDEFRRSIEPDRRPFIRAFERPTPPAPPVERKPRRYRDRSA